MRQLSKIESVCLGHLFRLSYQFSYTQYVSGRFHWPRDSTSGYLAGRVGSSGQDVFEGISCVGLGRVGSDREPESGLILG